jgi:hypothetical protein
MTVLTPIRSSSVCSACRRGPTILRVMVLTLLVGCLLGGGVRAQEPAAPQVRAANLVISHNGVPITNWLTIQGVPDSLTLTIVPQDSLGNAVPITGFEIQVWDRWCSASWDGGAGGQVVVRLQPRRRGQTTIQIGCRDAAVGVGGAQETVLAISPGQAEQPGVAYAPGMRYWTAGARLNLMTYSFDFQGDTTFAGKLGFLAEVYGDSVVLGFALVGGIGLGG